MALFDCLLLFHSSFRDFLPLEKASIKALQVKVHCEVLNVNFGDLMHLRVVHVKDSRQRGVLGVYKGVFVAIWNRACHRKVIVPS